VEAQSTSPEAIQDPIRGNILSSPTTICKLRGIRKRKRTEEEQEPMPRQEPTNKRPRLENEFKTERNDPLLGEPYKRPTTQCTWEQTTTRNAPVFQFLPEDDEIQCIPNH